MKREVNTRLGAQSDGLSGGHLQRIALAAVIYGIPGLLVLDETSSALNAVIEATVYDSPRILREK